MITEDQLKKVEKYVRKIQRLRAVMGADQFTPIQLVTRPRRYNHATFKRRKEEIRRLELAYGQYLKSITTG